jgi:2-oxoglutarate dehydrogenase complex dehydrogenase (E1) component-like enzyme
MNYKHRRSDVEDVIILVTTRTLQDRPSWDNDLLRAKKEIQMFAQMGVQVVTLALAKQRFRISMQMQQMTSYREPIILSSYKKLLRSDAKVLDVMKGVCPTINGVPGKFV